MISIAARLYDPDGLLVAMRPGDGSRIDEGLRRLSRSATLEPGVYIHDGGYVDGDRTVVLVIERPTEAQIETARRLVKLHNEVTASIRDGCFLGAPESWQYRGNNLEIVVLLKSKLSN